MTLKPNALAIFNYVKEAQEAGKPVTADDIAKATGIPVKSVNGSITRPFQMNGLMVREPATITDENGKPKIIKFIKLTDEGLAFDPEAAAEADAKAE